MIPYDGKLYRLDLARNKRANDGDFSQFNLCFVELATAITHPFKLPISTFSDTHYTEDGSQRNEIVAYYRAQNNQIVDAAYNIGPQVLMGLVKDYRSYQESILRYLQKADGRIRDKFEIQLGRDLEKLVTGILKAAHDKAKDTVALHINSLNHEIALYAAHEGGLAASQATHMYEIVARLNELGPKLPRQQILSESGEKLDLDGLRQLGNKVNSGLLGCYVCEIRADINSDIATFFPQVLDKNKPQFLDIATYARLNNRKVDWVDGLLDEVVRVIGKVGEANTGRYLEFVKMIIEDDNPQFRDEAICGFEACLERLPPETTIDQFLGQTIAQYQESRETIRRNRLQQTRNSNLRQSRGFRL